MVTLEVLKAVLRDVCAIGSLDGIEDDLILSSSFDINFGMDSLDFQDVISKVEELTGKDAPCNVSVTDTVATFLEKWR
jgi:acyl carrier protein